VSACESRYQWKPHVAGFGISMKKYDWIAFACDQQAHAVYVSKAALRHLRGLGSLGICASCHERVYSMNGPSIACVLDMRDRSRFQQP
jgi:hypothetical protein